MLHLALKAFYPAPPPFPFLHIDTTWKFREMIAFRDETAKRHALDLLVHVNEEGLERGISPFVHGSSLYTDVMKTQALTQALEKYGFRRRHRRCPSRRGKIPRQGAYLLIPLARRTAGIRDNSGRSSGASTTPALARARASESFLSRIGLNWMSGCTSTRSRFRSCRSTSPRIVPSSPVMARGSWWMMSGFPLAVWRSAPAETSPLPYAWLLPADRRDRQRCHDAARHHPRDARHETLGASGAGHRPRPGCVDGKEESRGILLTSARMEPVRSDLEAYLSLHETQGSAALHHVRQRRRWQVDVDREAALRIERDLRGSAGVARCRLAESRDARG